MRILFVHQNMPGQYKHLARLFGARADSEAVFITKAGKPQIEGVRQVVYEVSRKPTDGLHHYLTGFEDQVLHGQGVVRAALAEKKRGFRPDIILAHSGWGEALYLKDVFPDAKLLVYSEFWYSARGADVGFDPGQPSDLDTDCRTRTRNAHMALSLLSADWGLSPTRWQWSVHPEPLRQKISVIFDGIDSAVCAPDPVARMILPNGRSIGREDEVVTFSVRNLEPYRGFPQYMKAVEILQRQRPQAVFVIVGGDRVSYGKPPDDAVSWREKALRDCAIDPARTHFLGHLPYDRFLTVLKLSRVHAYLTYPFVLSWSMMEAMSTGCLIVGSNTAPVREVLTDGVNGLLCDFFDPEAIAARIGEALDRQDELEPLRRAARQTVLERYDLRSVCLPAHLRLIDTLVAGGTPDAG
ncbi:MAG: glycosyltransferase family 4 protein [Thalassobaculales bacterium]